MRRVDFNELSKCFHNKIYLKCKLPLEILKVKIKYKAFK